MFKKLLFALTGLILMFNATVRASGIEVEDVYDFQLAIQYAVSNHIDTLYLTTSGGVYTTTDTTAFLISAPLTIVAKEGLAEMPTITHSAADSSVLEIFRVANDFTIEGVILDGGHTLSHGMKYAIRCGDGPEDNPVPHKPGFNLTVRNCVFQNIYRDKDLEQEGHGIYFLKGIKAGKVLVENCTFKDIGDEAIRMTETEKYDTERCLDTLIVRNCSFTNIDAECVRFYADKDTATTDAYVEVSNISVNRSGTRMMYIKNNRNTKVRNILVTNSRLPGSNRAERADYVMQIQQLGSTIAYVDTINMVWGLNASDTRISSSKGGYVYKETIFGFDPDYEDEANFNLKLKPTSHAYYSGENNTHLGDLNNAVYDPQVSPLNVEVVGEGSVTFNPERVGLTFATGTNVTMTAVPDSGYQFKEWSGDVTGTDATVSITVDGIKNVTATFEMVTGVNDEAGKILNYNLSQNYPNPFNPSTLINFTLKKSGITTLKVFDVLGKEVAVVLNREMSAGNHQIIFDGSNLSSGLYFYQLQSGDFTATRKMMLLK